jgi:serine O-acetyltransferase
MTFKEVQFLIKTDLLRYRTSHTIKSFLTEYIRGAGFKYIFWWRINKYLDSKSFSLLLLKLWVKYHLHYWSFKLGIDISLNADIGPGFKIEHFGCIFINGQAKIGMRCSVLQGVTLGNYIGGAPILNNFVFMGPGSKVIGAVHIGDNAIVGANAVVTTNIPKNAVVVGIPGRIISLKGSIRDDYKKVFEEHNNIYQKLCPQELWVKYNLQKSQE